MHIRRYSILCILEILGKINTAAELAEMDKVDFMHEAGKHGVAVIDYETEDFNEELGRILKQ